MTTIKIANAIRISIEILSDETLSANLKIIVGRHSTDRYQIGTNNDLLRNIYDD